MRPSDGSVSSIVIELTAVGGGWEGGGASGGDAGGGDAAVVGGGFVSAAICSTPESEPARRVRSRSTQAWPVMPSTLILNHWDWVSTPRISDQVPCDKVVTTP